MTGLSHDILKSSMFLIDTFISHFTSANIIHGFCHLFVNLGILRGILLINAPSSQASGWPNRIWVID